MVSWRKSLNSGMSTRNCHRYFNARLDRRTGAPNWQPHDGIRACSQRKTDGSSSADSM
jgi:hypothetical protein